MTKHKRWMFRSVIFIALFAFSTVVTTIAKTSQVSADTQGLAGLIYDDKVYKPLSAHQHYWWLYGCFKNTDIDRITESEMNSWDFFQGNSYESALGAMYGSDGKTVNCENQDVVKTAFGYLGETDPRAAFCKIKGAQFDGNNVDEATCKAGPGGGDWDNNESKDSRTSSYKSLWGSKDPGLSGAATYMRAYSTFMQGCDVSFANDTIYPTKAAADDAGAAGTGNGNKFPVPVVVANDGKGDEPSSATFVVRYRLGVGVQGSTNQVVVSNSKSYVPATEYSTGVGSWTMASCDALVGIADDNAKAYALQLQLDGIPADSSTGSTTGDSSQPNPTCEVNGFGWVICPLINMMSDITEAVAGFLDDYLQVKPLTTDTGSVLYKGWGNMLGLANIVLILAFLMIIFAQATSFGISTYGIKKMLPRIIAAAILINISYFICAILVDLSNIIGANVAELIYSNLGGIASDGQTGGLAGGVKNIAGSITAGLIGASGLVVVAFFFLVPAVIAILSIFVVIAARSAIITLLIIISPLAFAAWILPNTDKWFKKWWDIFLQMLVVYPAVMAIFAASSAAAAIVADGSAVSSTDSPGPGNLFPLLIALLIQALPLLALPALIKLSSGVLARIDNISKSGIRRGADSGVGKSVRNKAKTYGKFGVLAAGSTINSKFGDPNKPGKMRRAYRYTRALDKATETSLEARKQGIQAETQERAAQLGTDSRFVGNTIGTVGGSRYQEIAAAQVDKASRDRVSSIRAQYETTGMKNDAISDRLESAIKSGNREEAAAAIQHLAKAGGAGGREALTETLVRATAGGVNTDMENAINTAIQRDSYGDLIEKRGDVVKGEFTNGKFDTAKGVGSLGTAQLAGQDYKTLLANFDTISEQEAKNIFANPALISKISDDSARQLLQARAEGKPVSSLPSSFSSDLKAINNRKTPPANPTPPASPPPQPTTGP